MQKLDKKDKELLYLLDFDGRANYTKLAKEMKTSKQVIEYRIKSLVEKNILLGFYPIINVPALGYKYCRLLLSLKQATQDIQNEMIEYLCDNDKFFWVFTGQGKYDVMAAMWATSITEFKGEVDKLLAKFGEYIQQKDTDFPTNVVYFQNRYFIDKKETKEIHISEINEHVTLDELETKLLEALFADARASLVSLATQLGVSAKVVSYRLRMLEKQGVIRGYRPSINYRALGYTYYKLWIRINYGSATELSNMKAYLKNNPVVLYFVEGLSFLEDLDIEVMVKSNEELFAFIQDLRDAFPKLIGNYTAVAFMGMHKARFLPF